MTRTADPHCDVLAEADRLAADDLPVAEVESRASDLAWQHRWEHWPATYEGLRRGLSRPPSRLATYACARRLHFHFAHRSLVEFCTSALEDFPDDEFLGQLLLAGRAVLGHRDAWGPLASAALTGTSKQAHVLLTAAFVSVEVPEETLGTCLVLARSLADEGDPVAAYRVASLLRRAGRYEEAFLACEEACEMAMLAGPSLGDHLSERLVTERHLITAGIRERSLELATAV